MANKYLLVPEDLYRGLIEVEPENINLNYEKRQLEKSKRASRKKDTWNTLYNQEQRRYLKLKKEQLNKPVKVELTNGAKLLSIPRTVPDEIPSPRTSEHDRTSNTGYQDDSFLLHNISEEGDEEEPQTFQRQPFVTPSHSRVTITTNQKRDELLNLIRANPQKFNVTANGKILNHLGNAIFESSISESISRLLSPHIGEASPKGTTVLQAAIRRDPEASRILEEGVKIRIDQQYTGVRRGQSRRPQKW
jgi:hypothetical protein